VPVPPIPSVEDSIFSRTTSLLVLGAGLLQTKPATPATCGVAQTVALPVVAFSTAGYVLYGSVDFVLGTAVGLVAAVGVVVGARIAHAARAAALRRVVATALLGAGLLIAAQTAWGSPVGNAAAGIGGPGPALATLAGPVSVLRMSCKTIALVADADET
jgi:hypothetical protein